MWTRVILVVLGASLIGCGTSSGPSASGGGSMDEMAAQVEIQEAARAEAQAKADAERKAQEEAAAKAAAEAPPERKVAGRESVEPGGYYTAIIGARRHILNEAESWAWKQGVQHFKATVGRKPKDHEEFMQKIVIPLEIDLGFKEENQEFFYDPNAESDGDFGVLYVVEVEEEPAQK